MRKLATIRTIDEVLPIEGADNIVLVRLDGWQCVALKSEFQPGDLCVYFEIDSWIPRMPQINHLYERAKKMFNGREGIKIKTIKLRGQISQGLALPIFNFPQVAANIPITGWNPLAFTEEEYKALIEEDKRRLIGLDVSEYLGVEKWEPPVPGQLGGQVKGNFPGFIQKTDQERCQNMGTEIFTYNKNSRYEVTMKLDGTSFTAFYRDGEDGVCGRNWQLDVNEENAGNSLVRMYVDSGLQAALRKLGKNIAIQGELLGPGIQKNREGLKAHQLFVFDIYDIDNMRYFTPHDRLNLLASLELNRDMVHHVPIIVYSANLYDTFGITNIDGLLKFAEGKSLNHEIREGLVFKREDGEFSFKVINNWFLLKEED
jgi:RNA ligase (TIGR02306 family)